MIAYRTTPAQRAAARRWYRLNRRRHIEAVRARYRRRHPARRAPTPEMTVEQIRNRAAELFNSVAVA